MSVETTKLGNDLFIHPDRGSVLMKVENFSTGDTSTANSKAKIKEPEDTTYLVKKKDWSIWGDSDSWPNDLIEKLSLLGVAKAALDLNSDLHYGSGIMWFKEQLDGDGHITHIPTNPDNWKRTAAKTGFNKALSDAINSLDTSGIAFIRVTLSANDGLFRAETLDFPSVRLGFRDTKGKINKVYYAQDIHLKSSKDESVVEYNVYDADDATFIEKNKVFVYIIKQKTWGRFYYPEPNYYATMKNGWADIALEVPKLIKSIYKNQATLKYQVTIPLSTFKAKHKCWDGKDEEEQLRLMASYKNDIQEIISKAEAAGTSVFSIYQDDLEPVKIIAIKDAIDNNKDLPNNVAANSEILFAIGVAPSLLGLNMPGGKDLNGSGGSQLRETLKAKQSTLTRERIATLDFAYLVADLNKYPEDVYPMFVDIDVSQTLDQNPTGKKTTVGA